jgi:hypothetical protein
MIDPPDIWKNPFQRMGMISVNVLIGNGIRGGDDDLFFGPLNGAEVWHFAAAVTPLNRLMADLQLFASAKEAARRGYSGDITEGFTDMIVTAAMKNTSAKKHRVTILKITREELDEPREHPQGS